mmetsp:Transcript_16390/g.41594  ORF Transcript_16390/g.41594 Transcript_16390/m.41594 type:complete len:160 (-) Transcript_16390:548-1027(-)|eukprot:CAMPEP_0113898702 /NCGR_PEP_ID=MMETSP0780_2-20120614/19564_1 /TAXON_ID=652834 /ORGANISM="Palpitomonas bilix" /LENGTH=159 /DNA_ID=CAMNT_0000890671 /DNA_START=352 /DNA_END=831 /DNA_ORIENTATION=- /assembly_acc=CAM_ASM_000599
MAGILHRVMLSVRDVAASTHLYTSALGMAVIRQTPTFCHLSDGRASIALAETQSEAMLSTGYNPLLCFNVVDLDSTLTAMLQQGARLDGPVRHPEIGKCCSVRTPDGHMINLFEPSSDFFPEEAKELAMKAMGEPLPPPSAYPSHLEPPQHKRDSDAES